MRMGRHLGGIGMWGALLLCSTALLFNAPPASAQQADQTPATAPDVPALSDTDARAFQRQGKEFQERGQALAKSADASQPLSPEEVLRQIPRPHTPGNIYRWVRDTIAFEPYAGALRGVQGTLIAGAGNAVDQALLTEALLRQAGHPTRFASGRLHAADATEVLQRAAGTAHLRSGSALPKLAAATLDPGLVAQLRDHIWVETRFQGAYIPVDPVAAPLVGMTPARAQEHSEKLPAHFETSFDIELVGRLNDTQRISHLTVSGPLPRYAYRTLSLAFEPDPTRNRGRVPVLAVGEQTTRGQSIPVEALESLELVFRLRFGDRERRWTQTLYRSSQDVDIFTFDQQHFGVTIIPGWSSDAWVARRAAQATSESAELLIQWSDSLAATAPPGADATHALETSNALLHRLNAALPAAFIRNLDRALAHHARLLGVHPLLTEPRAVVTATLRRGDQLYVDLQLSGDRVDATPLGNVPPVATAAFGGMYGQLLDTLTADFLESYGNRQIVTVARIFRHATSHQIPMTTLDARTQENLKRLPLDTSTHERITDQLRRHGRVTLSPTRSVPLDDVEHFGWWSVDPASGLMRAHPADAMLDGVPRGESHEVTNAQLLRAFSGHIDSALSATSAALQPTPATRSAICVATREYLALSRAFCATRQPLASPELSACLVDPQGGLETASGHDLLGLAAGSCTEQLARTRCGAVYARAIARGELQVLAGETSEEPELSSPLPHCP
ncbi:hypothetical protein DL240_04290 [Lujinxingia litoralis]|uniref:Transglutaminase-like domain-containing protein n=1 Tax=Lujinxingia litoralis TaxID=2211119 RepID=A0A328CCI7_9DELT|nr:transglutaminase family protein [Lujinxingia litoralis]RAL25436.1 hypothetical protein DL240_04290 [Lujinxingia litoralis]